MKEVKQNNDQGDFLNSCINKHVKRDFKRLWLFCRIAPIKSAWLHMTKIPPPLGVYKLLAGSCLWIADLQLPNKEKQRLDLSSLSLIFQILALKKSGHAFVYSKLPLKSHMRRRWEGVICLIATHTPIHTAQHKPISHSAQGWQAFTFKRLLWKAPLQCRRFQPQLYGEYIVVKLLMKMEESVYSSKQLSVKDGGSNLFSLRGAVLFPPLIATALMKSLHTWREWFRGKASGNILDVARKWKLRKQVFTLYVCLCGG